MLSNIYSQNLHSHTEQEMTNLNRCLTGHVEHDTGIYQLNISSSKFALFPSILYLLSLF